jgi:membrane associated rhomboid family serine protease
MFLPIGDEPNPRQPALVNIGLIIVNCAVFLLVSLPLMGKPGDPSDPLFAEYVNFLLGEGHGVSARALAAQVSAYDLFVFEHGFRPSVGGVATLFSSMFLHGGWAHLLGNMLFLWIYGDNVENRLGRAGYLALYLATGVAATLFFALFQGSSDVPLVGASGAISGVLGIYFLWFPDNRVKVLVLLLFIVDVWRIPARWVLGFYIVAQNIFPFLMGGAGGGGVAYGAHIGGFVAGLGAAAGLSRLGARRGGPVRHGVRARGDRVHEDAVFAPVVQLTPRGPKAFKQALAMDGWHEALQIYIDMQPEERDRLDPADALRFADWLTDQGQYDVAMALLQRMVMLHARDAQWVARAHLRLGLILLHFKSQPQAASEHFYQVLELSTSEEMQQVARNGLAQARAGRSELN